MEESTKIKIIYDRFSRVYKVQQSAKFGGFGDGTQMNIKGIYNFLKNFTKAKDSELIGRISSDGLGLSIETEVINELEKYIQSRNSK